MLMLSLGALLHAVTLGCYSLISTNLTGISWNGGSTYTPYHAQPDMIFVRAGPSKLVTNRPILDGGTRQPRIVRHSGRPTATSHVPPVR
jgi:hypothetical protein